MTREEFSLFLLSLAVQGSSSAQLYRSALVFDQRRNSVQLFANETTFIKEATGVSKNVVKQHKGVITTAMLVDLQELILGGTATFVSPCKHCIPFLSLFKTLEANAVIFNSVLSEWINFQYSARLRPGEGELLKIRDKITTMQELADVLIEVNALLFSGMTMVSLSASMRLVL